MHTFGGLDDAGRVCGPDKGLWVAVCFGDEALYGRLEGRASIRRSFCAGWLECARTGPRHRYPPRPGPVPPQTRDRHRFLKVPSREHSPGRGRRRLRAREAWLHLGPMPLDAGSDHLVHGAAPPILGKNLDFAITIEAEPLDLGADALQVNDAVAHHAAI
jgi:hypothetical protein